MSLLDIMRAAEKQGVEDEAAIYQVYKEYLDYNSRKNAYPRGGILELTPRCNFDCKMCYVHLDESQMNGIPELSGDRWIEIIDAAISEGMMYCQLTGGEAMMHPDFERIYLHLYDNGIQIAVMTNGLLLTEQRVEFFKKHPPNSIQVTLYGMDDDTYEKITGLRVFDVVKKNLLNAKTIDCRLNISATPSKLFAYDDVKKYLEFAKENDLKCQINNDLIEPREDTGREVESLEISLDEYVRIFKLRYEFDGIEVKSFEDELPMPNSASSENEKENRGLKCAAGNSMFCVNWRGKLMACLDLQFSEDLSKVDFKDAWVSIHRQAEDYLIPSECTECKYKRSCKLCPVVHSKGAPVGHCDTRVCDKTQRLIKEGLIKLVDD